jgi:predicted SAM-dependent methyltransferase
MKLNLCCGTNIFPGWLNVDRSDLEADYLRHLREAPAGFVWPGEQQAHADAVRAGKLEFMRHDVRKGLPWADGSVDAVYVGQAIEHFNRRTEAPRFLRECCRVLKRGGMIKLTTPDIQKLILALLSHRMHDFAKEQPDFYADADPLEQFAYVLFGASGGGCTTEHYEGHFHCYSEETLAKLLSECGFVRAFGSFGVFPERIDKGMSHSFAIEAVKP